MWMQGNVMLRGPWGGHPGGWGLQWVCAGVYCGRTLGMQWGPLQGGIVTWGCCGNTGRLRGGEVAAGAWRVIRGMAVPCGDAGDRYGLGVIGVRHWGCTGAGMQDWWATVGTREVRGLWSREQ